MRRDSRMLQHKQRAARGSRYRFRRLARGCDEAATCARNAACTRTTASSSGQEVAAPAALPCQRANTGMGRTRILCSVGFGACLPLPNLEVKFGSHRFKFQIRLDFSLNLVAGNFNRLVAPFLCPCPGRQQNGNRTAGAYRSRRLRCWFCCVWRRHRSRCSWSKSATRLVFSHGRPSLLN